MRLARLFRLFFIFDGGQKRRDSDEISSELTRIVFPRGLLSVTGTACSVYAGTRWRHEPKRNKKTMIIIIKRF